MTMYDFTYIYAILAINMLAIIYNMYENWRQRIMLENLQEIDRETDKRIETLERRLN